MSEPSCAWIRVQWTESARSGGTWSRDGGSGEREGCCCCQIDVDSLAADSVLEEVEEKETEYFLSGELVVCEDYDVALKEVDLGLEYVKGMLHDSHDIIGNLH